MENEASSLELLFARSEQWCKTSIELIRLKAIRTATDSVSSSLSMVVVLMIFWLSIIIGSLGASLWIGECLGKTFYGFFVVSLFYLLLALLIFIFRNQWIKNPLNRFFIKQALK